MNTTPPPVVIPLAEPFLSSWLYAFRDNEFQNITEATFRNFATDIDGKFARLDTLNTNQVRGALFRVPYVQLVNGEPTVPTALIPARFRIQGMDARAINGTDQTSTAGGVKADPIDFRLIANTAGTIDALVDEKGTTTATVKCAWVRTSGTDAEKVASFPVFILEDHAYKAGDVFQYTFAGGQTRLLEVINDLNVTQNPLPTGLDTDPNYKSFAPLTAGTGGVSQASFDALEGRVTQAEADLVFLEQEVTDLQNEHADLQTENTQTRGWIGTLGSLLTSTKGNLVAAINEVLGKIPVAYTRLGFNSDGYLTQAYATTILATKAATAYTPNYQVEVAAGGTLSPGLNGGKSYTLNGTNVQLDNPATDPSSYGKVDLYRVIGQQTAKLTAAPGATIDGNPSVTFQPGEWFVLKQQAGGHTIVMRASTLTPTPGAGSTYTAGAGINISPQNVISATSTGSSGALDYVNFVAHATNTVLSVADMGKHHVFTGTGQSLWTVALPAAADVAGKLISMQVGNSASGMWELQAADIDGEPARRMWSREVALLWSNGTSWRKLGGRSIPLVLTVGFPNGNQALGGQQITTLNFTQKVSGNAPDEMLFAAGLAIRALRKGLYEPALTAYCIGSSQFRPIQAIASVNGDYGSARSVNTPCLVGADGAGLFYSSLSMASNPLALDAGDYVNIKTYTDAAIEVQNYDALRPRFSLNEVLTW
ncbi:hypothetical protein [Hymenobacter convexus]|uniref:hypothetical protein n=1 Tax=Hymenobacter sp. CA1UV-4 TaxID=3063782 RepID=UPI002712C9D3|nr:hypothetical protein [Hymenobacter sp. CA1UV-4]MDO7853168.1 hypothetical protein [Hymenobacter sp. CA1UV-4]